MFASTQTGLVLFERLLQQGHRGQWALLIPNTRRWLVRFSSTLSLPVHKWRFSSLFCFLKERTYYATKRENWPIKHVRLIIMVSRMVSVAVVTGGNKGIGLSIVKKLWFLIRLYLKFDKGDTVLVKLSVISRVTNTSYYGPRNLRMYIWRHVM